MNRFKSLIAGSFVVLVCTFVLTPVRANQTESLSGASLLKAIRQMQGKPDQPSYEERAKQELQEKASAKKEEKDVADVNVAAAPKTDTKTQPVKETIAEQKVEATAKAETKTAAAVSEPAVPKAASAASDKLLSIIPADSIAVIRVNNFDYTLNQLDQYLTGVSPMPLGLSMVVRMQLAQLFGSPDLKGVDMDGSFAVFAMPPEVKQTEGGNPSEPAGYAIMPIKDYNQFTEGNANVGKPEPNGVFKITTPYGKPTEPNPLRLSAKQVDNFLLIGGPDLLTVAQSRTNGSKTFAGTLDSTLSRSAISEPVWIFMNTQKFAQTAGGLPLPLKLPMTIGPTTVGEVNSVDFLKIFNELQYISVSLSPQPNVLKINITVAATAGSETAKKLKADSPEMLALIQQTGAVKRAEAGAKLAEVTKLLPTARGADFVGTYNLLKSIEAMSAMTAAGGETPKIEAKSSLAFSIKFTNNKITAQIALPKEHLAEIVMNAMKLFMPGQNSSGAGVVGSIDANNTN